MKYEIYHWDNQKQMIETDKPILTSGNKINWIRQYGKGENSYMCISVDKHFKIIEEKEYIWIYTKEGC